MGGAVGAASMIWTTQAPILEGWYWFSEPDGATNGSCMCIVQGLMAPGRWQRVETPSTCWISTAIDGWTLERPR